MICFSINEIVERDEKLRAENLFRIRIPFIVFRIASFPVEFNKYIASQSCVNSNCFVTGLLPEKAAFSLARAENDSDRSKISKYQCFSDSFIFNSDFYVGIYLLRRRFVQSALLQL